MGRPRTRKRRVVILTTLTVTVVAVFGDDLAIALNAVATWLF